MFFRSMIPAEDGSPRLERSARGLGVRIPKDIQPDEHGNVLPQRGGMSVAPESLWNLPHHRRPRGMGRGSTGPDTDRVFSIGQLAIETAGLTIRPDPNRPRKHAFVEPPAPLQLENYEKRLSSTRKSWSVVSP